MKITTILGAMLIGLFLFSACDKIEEPYKKEIEAGDGTPVLLEEFTGHRCVNCPAAHLLAEGLMENNNGKVIVISIHAGYYASPSDELPEDFQTTVGDELNENYSISSNPIGLVNRGEEVIYTADWASKVAEQMAEEPKFSLELLHSYDEASRKINLALDIKSLKSLSGDYWYTVYITESHIIAPQLNNDHEVGEVPLIEEYEHNHVLRASMNGTWGSELFSGNINSGETFMKELSYTLPTDWVDNNCHLVGFITNKESKRVVMVSQVDVIEN